MHRRVFIKLSGTLTAISTIPWLSACTTDPREILITPQTLGTFCAHEELIAVGKSYCEMNAGECNQSSLEQLLLKDGDKLFPKTDTPALEDFLRQKITNEFKTGDLAIVSGWVLSRTEARQVALYSLLS